MITLASWNAVVDEFYRWEDVEIVGTIDGEVEQSLAEKVLQTPAPSLRRFYWRGVYHLMREDVCLFSEDAPLLQDLHIGMMRLRDAIRNISVRNLRALELHVHSSTDSVDMRGILASNPNLESFLLYEGKPEAHAEPADLLNGVHELSSERTVLSNLKRLDVKLRPPILKRLFALILVPRCANIQVRSLGSTEDLTAVLKTLVILMEKSGRSEDLRSWLSRTSVSCTSTEFIVGDRGNPLHIKMNRRSDGARLGSLGMVACLNALTGSELPRVICGFMGGSDEAIRDTVTHLSSLRVKHLSFDSWRDIDPILEAMGHPQPIQNDTAWLLPTLQKLTLNWCPFASNSLLNMVVGRYKRSDGPSRLQSLVIKSGSAGEHDKRTLATLEQVLGTGVVTWSTSFAS